MTPTIGRLPRAARRRRVAAVLVGVYPRQWRNRYGEELVDLIAAAPLTGFVVLDVVRGALDAHLILSEPVCEGSGMLARIRSAAASTLAGWALFCFAAAVVGSTTNDPRFDEAANAHPLIGALRWLATAGLAVSLLVVVCTGLPIAVVTAWQARLRRDRAALALFAAPPAGLAVFIGYTALLGQVPEQPVHSVENVVITVSWLLLGVSVAEVAGVGAATALIRRTEFSPALLRLAGWAAPAAAAAMSLALLAGAGYGVGIWIERPSLFLSSKGMLATPLPLTWAAALLIATAATATATLGARRGMRALSTRA